MKRVFILMLPLLTFLLFCTGPVGPEGPQGEKGERGPAGIPGKSGTSGIRVFSGKITSSQYSEDYYEGNALLLFVEGDTSWNLFHSEIFFSLDSIVWADLELHTAKIEMNQVMREITLTTSPQIGIASDGVVISVWDSEQDLIGSYYKIVTYSEE